MIKERRNVQLVHERGHMGLPVIGITMSYDAEENNFFSKESYAACIVRAGGLPLLIPSDERLGREAEYAQAVSGLVFAGGGDIAPGYFGEEPLDGFETGNTLPQRDSFELRLYGEAKKRGLPMLGICRGIQLMAVADGGSIYQDIDTGVKRARRIRHMQKAPDWCETHTVTILPDTRLASLYGVEQMMTNSFHHQAVKKVPFGYRVSALSEDGIVEAIESEALPFCIGVQWHPERTAGRDEKTAQLFQRFVECALQYKEKQGEWK